jgi:hypothetical protein
MDLASWVQSFRNTYERDQVSAELTPATTPPTDKIYAANTWLRNSAAAAFGDPWGWTADGAGNWRVIAILGATTVTPTPSPSPGPAPTPTPATISILSPAEGATVSGVVPVTVQLAGTTPFTLAKLFDASANELLTFSSFDASTGAATGSFNSPDAAERLADMAGGRLGRDADEFQRDGPGYGHGDGRQLDRDADAQPVSDADPGSDLHAHRLARLLRRHDGQRQQQRHDHRAVPHHRQHAAAAAASSTTKQVYIRAGTYSIGSAIALTSSP